MITSPKNHTTVSVRKPTLLSTSGVRGQPEGWCGFCLGLVEPTAVVRKQTLTDIFIDEGDKDGRLRCLMSQRTS
jgi:hypothetical protein